MAQLDELMLLGVRNVGPREEVRPHILKFLDPLTIITGANGSGKTTIIEALKFITTGALPPGKMNAFIHNINESTHSRVDALVKLAFKNLHGARVVATKRMNSTYNKGKVVCKSDEFTLHVEQEEKMLAISAKVVDMKREMLNHLGLPAAILDYVIFCHQNDSCWPLSEPKELKLRFDEIFGVSKYVKAMEQMKKMKKEMESELAKTNAVLSEMAYKRKRRKELISKRCQLERRLEAIGAEVDDIVSQKGHHEKGLSELRKQIAKAEQLERRKEIVTVEARQFQQQLDGMRCADYAGTKETLDEEIRKLGETSEMRDVTTRRTETARKLKGLQEMIGTTESERRRAEERAAESLANEKQVVGLDAEIAQACTSAARTYNIDSTNPSDVEARLRAALKAARDEKESISAAAGEKMLSLQQRADALNREAAQAKNQAKMRRQMLARIRTDVCRVQEEIRTAEGSNKEVLELVSSIEAAEKDLKRLIARLEKNPNDKDARELMEIAERQLGYMRRTLSLLAPQQSGIKNQKQRLESLMREAEETEATAERDEMRVPEIEKELEMVRDERSQAQKETQNDANKYLAKITDVEAVLARLVDLERRKRRFSEGKQDAAALRKQAQQCAERVEQMRADVQALQRQDQELSDKETQKRRLEEQRIKMEVKVMLAKKKEELEEMQWRGEPLDQMKRHARTLEQRLTEANEQTAQRNGEKTQLVEQKAECARELQKKEIADSIANFHKSTAEKCIMEAAVQDIDKYVSNVDRILLSYHSEKMAAINDQLDLLWRRVYVGSDITDIDSIMIKSEPVEDSEKRRSYNYRVVMKRMDSLEIDMRDRCSAGQRQLASLLIRIALADVFGGQCTMIALDEPTSNLDASKVNNMAEILHAIVQTRRERGRGKFQLIVISHDIKFVDRLRQKMQPDWYYELSRDVHGHSQIKRVTRGGERELVGSGNFAKQGDRKDSRQNIGTACAGDSMGDDEGGEWAEPSQRTSPTAPTTQGTAPVRTTRAVAMQKSKRTQPTRKASQVETHQDLSADGSDDDITRVEDDEHNVEEENYVAVHKKKKEDMLQPRQGPPVAATQKQRLLHDFLVSTAATSKPAAAAAQQQDKKRVGKPQMKIESSESTASSSKRDKR